MSKNLYVYSTLATDMKYGPHHIGAGEIPIREEHVLIFGKAGITTERFITPRGTVTRINEGQLALLEQDPVFLMHQKNGYIVVDDSDLDPDMMAESMNESDPSKPLTEKDFVNEKPVDGTTRIQPVTPPRKK